MRCTHAEELPGDDNQGGAELDAIAKDDVTTQLGDGPAGLRG
jgi:hypothetical protein